MRDGSGYLVDFLFQPTTYVLPGITLFIYASIHQGSAGLTALEANADAAAGARGVVGRLLRRAAQRVLPGPGGGDRGAPRQGPGARSPALLGALSLGPSGGEVGDLAAQHGGQGVEAVPLED